MTIRPTLALLALTLLPPSARAQHAGGAGASAPPVTAPRDAAQFDFLIGQWELTVRPQVAGLAARIHGSPRLAGTWKAWRAFDGWGIEDELRIVDASANPVSLGHSLRVFDQAARRWSLTTLDAYRGRFSTGTAEWRNGEMILTSRGTDAEGRAYLSRTRFSDIGATAFRFQQDRSFDEGRTWTEAVLRIDARRVAATAPR